MSSWGRRPGCGGAASRCKSFRKSKRTKKTPAYAEISDEDDQSSNSEENTSEKDYATHNESETESEQEELPSTQSIPIPEVSRPDVEQEGTLREDNTLKPETANPDTPSDESAEAVPERISLSCPTIIPFPKETPSPTTKPATPPKRKIPDSQFDWYYQKSTVDYMKQKRQKLSEHGKQGTGLTWKEICEFEYLDSKITKVETMKLIQRRGRVGRNISKKRKK